MDAHLNVMQTVAAGIKALPQAGEPFAVTQAAWRFFQNPRVTLTELIQPIQKLGRRAAQQSLSPYVLLAFDWSKLDFDGHANKKDLTQLSQKRDRGYELATALLIDAQDGSPLAPMGLSVLCARGMHTTESDQIQPRTSHLEQVRPWMERAESWELGKTPVFVIDREADSVRHFRDWNRNGHRFLARVDDRCVEFRQQKTRLEAVVSTLEAEDAFTRIDDVTLRGQSAVRWVAQTEVTLTEPGWTTDAEGKTKRVPGEPLPVELVVVQLRQKDGEFLSQWLLLTNVANRSCVEIANWYYWRWRIESFHKLLKSSGLEVEEWLQESALAIAKRLLVGCMACVTVWALERDESAEAQACRKFLMKLSGRQRKRNRPVTTPGLLCGLHLLIVMLEILETHSMDELKAYAETALPNRQH